jgi:hypothetical protein
MAEGNEHQMDFLELIGRMNEEKNISFFCRDLIDSDVTSEHGYFQQAQRFLITARRDSANEGLHSPQNSDYLLLALIGKDMLARSNRQEYATAMTGITLAFRSLQPIEIDEVGINYRNTLNCSIYNMRNKLLFDFFHSKGIWALVNNNVAANLQYDKIDKIRKDIEFRVDDPLRNDIYLLKTKNYMRHAPGHYILLINKYCFHLINVGLFSGDYIRMKAQLFQNIISFERVGSTTLEINEIDLHCRKLAAQSHSLFFNNCQNFATNVYESICEEKGIRVELPSFSGLTVIIQVLLIIIVCLMIFIVFKIAF